MSHKPEPPSDDPTLVPMSGPEAKKLANQIVDTGVVIFSGHAKQEMAGDSLGPLDVVDARNMLRGGVFAAPEYINGELRYRVVTPKMCLVFVFKSRERLRVVTMWRKK
jgi:hypothetical protein